MASLGYVEALLGTVESGLRRTLKEVFRYLLGNLRLGRIEDQSRSENLQAYYYTATTAAASTTTFSFTHGLGRAPYLLVPVLPLDVVNAQLVPLSVPQASDSQRVYLRSTTTSATIYVLVEG